MALRVATAGDAGGRVVAAAEAGVEQDAGVGGGAGRVERRL
jgi:hypothetical protein